jgi:hypothetical protein
MDSMLTEEVWKKGSLHVWTDEQEMRRSRSECIQYQRSGKRLKRRFAGQTNFWKDY